jgi:hypothetical protein
VGEPKTCIESIITWSREGEGGGGVRLRGSYREQGVEQEAWS